MRQLMVILIILSTQLYMSLFERHASCSPGTQWKMENFPNNLCWLDGWLIYNNSVDRKRAFESFLSAYFDLFVFHIYLDGAEKSLYAM